MSGLTNVPEKPRPNVLLGENVTFGDYIPDNNGNMNPPILLFCI